MPMHNTSQNIQCTQEARIAILEAAVGGINETLHEMRDLLKSSIRSEEQIRSLWKTVETLKAELKESTRTQGKRIGKTEIAHATTAWLPRLGWMILASAVSFYFGGKL